jgi:hypothetical protein
LDCVNKFDIYVTNVYFFIQLAVDTFEFYSRYYEKFDKLISEKKGFEFTLHVSCDLKQSQRIISNYDFYHLNNLILYLLYLSLIPTNETKIFKCEYCEKLFESDRKQKYCSKKCANAVSKARKYKTNKNQSIKKIIKKECANPNCNRVFESTHGNEKYCSKECTEEAKQIRLNKRLQEANYGS